MSSHVREAYGEGVRGIMKGMGGLSGPCRTHKATPEELAEIRQKVADHAKVWGKPQKMTRLDRMLLSPGRHSEITKKSRIRAMMRDRKMTIEQIADAAGASVAYARDVAYEDKNWYYLSDGSKMKKKWQAEEVARGERE